MEKLRRIQGRNQLEVMINSFSEEELVYWDLFKESVRERFKRLPTLPENKGVEEYIKLARLSETFRGKNDDVPIFIRKDNVIIDLNFISKEEYVKRYL